VKVESSNESDFKDEISETKQEDTDSSDDNDEEFDEPPKKAAKRSQPKPKVSKESFTYSCTKPKCGKKFQYEHTLEAHMKKHDGIDVSQLL
jgi:hypothetical protein